MLIDSAALASTFISEGAGDSETLLADASRMSRAALFVGWRADDGLVCIFAFAAAALILCSLAATLARC